MKNILFLIIIFCFNVSSAQFTDVNLNGKTFKGTVTEILPPDVDRMPQMYDELIRFVNGKVYSDILNIYNSEECTYKAQIDDRRMVALTLTDVHFKTTGITEGINVIIEFNGNLSKEDLAGILSIKYPDNTEINYKFVTEPDPE